MKTLLRNGKIYDGSGADAFAGDILIEDSRIIQTAEHIEAEADQTINLMGRSVAPGFMDAHSHNDWFAIKRDPLPYFEPFIRQGIPPLSPATADCRQPALKRTVST